MEILHVFVGLVSDLFMDDLICKDFIKLVKKRNETN